MHRRSMFIALVVVAVVATVAPAAGAYETDPGQHGGTGGHLPGSSANVELVGKLELTTDEGRIADVFGFGNFAYLGAYLEGQPLNCQNGGVYVVDISNPSKPKQVQFIRSANDTYVSEGVQVIHIDTPAFNGDVLVHNNETCLPQGGSSQGIGGIDLVDVTNPRQPKILAQGVGDHTNDSGSTSVLAHEVHSAFMWDAGNKAYVMLTDDNDIGGLDVDIMDITDPRNPVLISETGLQNWPGAQDDQSAGLGNFAASFLHDMQVRQFGKKWLGLLSYWDAGWVILDVTNPANPVFVGDTTYPVPDTLLGHLVAEPEGNAHQGWWSADGKFFIGTDEDLDAFRFLSQITSGPFTGTDFPVTQGSDVPQVGPGSPLGGPTRFVGRACNTSPAVPAAGSGEIAVVERGDCTFTEKATNVSAAGYVGGIVFNSETGDPPCENLVSMLVSGNIPFLFTTRSSGFAILGVTGYNPDNCPGGANPPLPAIGTAGSGVNISAEFDGWGYIRLFNSNSLNEVDALNIDEGDDPAFAQGFGDLDVHEVETDDTRNLAYLAWYAGGFRVVKFGPTGLEEVGHYIDADGNNFWGVDPHVDPRNGQTIVLLSDRDSGLWIFRYTGP